MRLLPLLLVLSGLLPARAHAAAPPADQPTTPVRLERGRYDARFFPPAPGRKLRALVVFGSGDGGWSYWEERVGRHLAGAGIAVAGVDFHAYSAADFSPAILRRDYRALVAELRRRLPDADNTPVLYGGWSMGAEQALPAAAEPEGRAPGLRGLVLVSPGARGRYGLHLRDRMGFTPTGPGTFGLRDLAPACADLRLAVFHAGLDPLDDLAWSEGLRLDLKRWTVPKTFHDFDGAGEEFLAALDASLKWLLAPPAEPSAAAAP